MAIAGSLAHGHARADGPEAGASLELLRLQSIEPIEGGFAVTFRVQEDELGQLALEALDAYLRDNRPQLFTDRSFGLVRYENSRIVPRELRARARPDEDNVLDVQVTADVIADKHKRELICESDGWKPSCENRWVDRGTGPIAALKASGEVRLSVRDDGALAGRPLSAEVFLRRTRGSLKLGGLVGVSLEMDFEPPYRADTITLGLPNAARARVRRFGELALRELRVAAAPERTIEITASVARPPPSR